MQNRATEQLLMPSDLHDDETSVMHHHDGIQQGRQFATVLRKLVDLNQVHESGIEPSLLFILFKYHTIFGAKNCLTKLSMASFVNFYHKGKGFCRLHCRGNLQNGV